MTIEFWLKEADQKLFAEVCDAKLVEYLDADDILTGKLENTGLLNNISKRFVLGRKGIWISRGTVQKNPFVYIKNNSAYPEGLILTPYSREDMISHLKVRTIDQKTNIHREELIGTDTEDFVGRAFRTYDSSQIRKFSENDKHLVLYASDK